RRPGTARRRRRIRGSGRKRRRKHARRAAARTPGRRTAGGSGRRPHRPRLHALSFSEGGHRRSGGRRGRSHRPRTGHSAQGGLAARPQRTAGCAGTRAALHVPLGCRGPVRRQAPGTGRTAVSPGTLRNGPHRCTFFCIFAVCIIPPHAMARKEKIRTNKPGTTARLFSGRKMGDTERWIYGFLLLFVSLFFLLAVVSYYFTWSEDQAALREGLSWSAVDNVANHAGKLGAMAGATLVGKWFGAFAIGIPV